MIKPDKIYVFFFDGNRKNVAYLLYALIEAIRILQSIHFAISLNSLARNMVFGCNCICTQNCHTYTTTTTTVKVVAVVSEQKKYAETDFYTHNKEYDYVSELALA